MARTQECRAANSSMTCPLASRLPSLTRTASKEGAAFGRTRARLSMTLRIVSSPLYTGTTTETPGGSSLMGASATQSTMEHFFRRAVEPAIHELHALHQGVVLVADLVFPGPEAAARVDLAGLEVLVDHGQGLVPVHARDRVGVPGVDQVLRLDQGQVRAFQDPFGDEPLDDGLDEVSRRQRPEAGVGRLHQQRAVTRCVSARDDIR